MQYLILRYRSDNIYVLVLNYVFFLIYEKKNIQVKLRDILFFQGYGKITETKDKMVNL